MIMHACKCIHKYKHRRAPISQSVHQVTTLHHLCHYREACPTQRIPERPWSWDVLGVLGAKKLKTPLVPPPAPPWDHPNPSSKQCRRCDQPRWHQQKHPRTSNQPGALHRHRAAKLPSENCLKLLISYGLGKGLCGRMVTRQALL